MQFDVHTRNGADGCSASVRCWGAAATAPGPGLSCVAWPSRHGSVSATVRHAAPLVYEVASDQAVCQCPLGHSRAWLVARGENCRFSLPTLASA